MAFGQYLSLFQIGLLYRYQMLNIEVIRLRILNPASAPLTTSVVYPNS